MATQIKSQVETDVAPVASLKVDVPLPAQDPDSPGPRAGLNEAVAAIEATGSIRRMEGMGKFGDTLRQEREFRGITLDAITRITKISNRHLQALEQENFDVLPGGVFNKSMVREYARVVGLDQEEWVGRYLSAHKPKGGLADEDGWMRFAENASKARGSGQRNGPDQRLRWAGIALLLILVAGLSWFVWSYVHKKISLNLPPLAAPTAQAMNVSRPLVTSVHPDGDIGNFACPKTL